MNRYPQGWLVAQDLPSLIALAKAKPGTLSIAIGGIGSSLHLAGPPHGPLAAGLLRYVGQAYFPAAFLSASLIRSCHRSTILANTGPGPSPASMVLALSIDARTCTRYSMDALSFQMT
jgi:hypothetical protein